MNTNVENILFGGELPITKTSGYNSLGKYLYDKLKEYGNKTLLIDSVTNEEITANQLLKRSLSISMRLESYGIKANDVIIICSENVAEFIYALVGSIFLGANVFPLSTAFVKMEFNCFFSIAQPVIVFTSIDTLDRILEVSQSHASIKHIISFGKDDRCIDLNEMLLFSETIIIDSFPFADNLLSFRDNIAVTIMSSGLNGLPKGAKLSQANIFAAIEGEFLEPSNYYIATTPFAYITAFIMMTVWIALGKKSIILKKFDLKIFLSCIEKFQIKSVFAPPPIMRMLAEHPLVETYNLTSIDSILYGSAAIDQNFIDKIAKRIKVPNLKVRQTYGLSESIGILAQPFNGKSKTGSLGFLRPGCYGKVVDPNTGTNLGPNQMGLMLFKGPHTMLGYLNDPGATEIAFDKNSFLNTGDIGYYDDDGEWYFVERSKELIKCNNISIAPGELECILLKHPNVKDATVIGVPDPMAGELPMAFVVPSGIISEKELIDYVAEHVSSQKYLRGGLRFIENIPKCENHRNILKQLAF